jgi:hypothetical protein
MYVLVLGAWLVLFCPCCRCASYQIWLISDQTSFLRPRPARETCDSLKRQVLGSKRAACELRACRNRIFQRARTEAKVGWQQPHIIRPQGASGCWEGRTIGTFLAMDAERHPLLTCQGTLGVSHVPTHPCLMTILASAASCSHNLLLASTASW